MADMAKMPQDNKVNEMQENFLKKVDDISALIKEMTHGNPDEQEAAKDKADVYIEKVERRKARENEKEEALYGKIGFDTTIVNKEAFDNSQPERVPGDTAMGQETMMRALEKDAQDRSQRRARQYQEATVIKEKGNDEFRVENYEAAIKLYTEALSIIKGYTALWTNRAQCHLKLGNYQDALNDCDWALRVSDKCIKAYAHQGKAYLGLKQYDKARESFKHVVRCDPKKECLVKEYLAEVDHAQTAEEDEEKARQVFDAGDEGAMGLVEILQKIKKPDQLPLYYSGGMRILNKVIVNNNDRTLFRTNGGLNLVKEQKVISSNFRVNPSSQNQEGRDLCWALLELYTNVCKENEENIRQLLEIDDFTTCLHRFLESKKKPKLRLLEESAVKFLVTISESATGRSLIIKKFEIPRLLSSLFPIVSLGGLEAGNVMGLLNNLAIDTKFKADIRNNVERFLPSFEALMRDTTSSHLPLLSLCITTITNLTTDALIRQKMANRKELWDTCEMLLKTNVPKHSQKLREEIVFATLGLIANLALEACEPCQAASPGLTRCCCPLVTSEITRIQSRTLGVLGRLLQRSSDAAQVACGLGVHKTVLGFLKDGELCNEDIGSCVKCLVSCSKMDDVGHDIMYEGKGLSMLLTLLKHQDESIVGNAALCLTNCLDVKGVCKRLTETDIVKDLLVLARDGRKQDCQQNCAILLGKLAMKDARHLEKLRELHGIEILNNCMKFIK